MKQRVIFVFSHDSIGVGEDGPTHQPIEQLASLRLIPDLTIWRPCDQIETAVAWQAALEQKSGPSCLLLTRQKVAAQKHSDLSMIYRGGYILKECNTVPEIILIATGSEVTPTIEAAELLTQQGKKVRVVSMPSCEVFLRQDRDYREEVLLPNVACKVAIEAGVTAAWHRFVGEHGKVIGLDHFGESAPEQEIFADFGLTAHNIADITLDLFYKLKI